MVAYRINIGLFRLGKRHLEAIRSELGLDVADRWLGSSQPTYLGTNHSSITPPIADWYRFKEAFTPEVVRRAIVSNPIPVERCFDPFGGAGTTALTCQMMGVQSYSIEVNPFLADLIKAKTHNYNLQTLKSAVVCFLDRIENSKIEESPQVYPPTFIQPGKNGRWIFDSEVAAVLNKAKAAVNAEPNEDTRKLLRVAVGSILSSVSNVVINGKGRRYRQNWQSRNVSAEAVHQEIATRLAKIVLDIENFSDRHHATASVVNDDARHATNGIPRFDLSIFSPPYPNSFDYTDVYNLELWMLGYLSSKEDNFLLRRRTLSSHVQVGRAFLAAPTGSPKLENTLEEFKRAQGQLWHPRLGDMIGSYFQELLQILKVMRDKKSAGGHIWIVVGNSKYAGIEVASADILAELANRIGYEIIEKSNTRDMRTSPQQGGQKSLAENLLIIS